jgi:hypothetical protein
MDKCQIGLYNLNDTIRILRTLNIKNWVKLAVSIYGCVGLNIHVLKDGSARSDIFTTLFLFKYHYPYILCTDWQKLCNKRYVYFQVLLFHICIYETNHMKFFSSNCYKTALFSTSKLLWQGIAWMDSDRFVVTNNRRMLQNDSPWFLLVSYT